MPGNTAPPFWMLALSVAFYHHANAFFYVAILVCHGIVVLPYSAEARTSVRW